MTTETPGDNPAEIARSTQSVERGDVADEADRLATVMEAEAVHNARAGGSGEGSLDGYEVPLEADEYVLASEDAADSSDDPMHAGGFVPRPIREPEVSAMHVVDDSDPERDFYVDDEADVQRADPDFDQFDGTEGTLTVEDRTLWGIDPYA